MPGTNCVQYNENGVSCLVRICGPIKKFIFLLIFLLNLKFAQHWHSVADIELDVIRSIRSITVKIFLIKYNIFQTSILNKPLYTIIYNDLNYEKEEIKN